MYFIVGPSALFSPSLIFTVHFNSVPSPWWISLEVVLQSARLGS